jgi:UDP-N-acetylglucosamine 2-epimerase (non-hydrolysing)
MEILISYGTRPEWLKVKPLWERYPECFKLLKVNQHTDLLNDLPFDYEINYHLSNKVRLNEIVINNLNASLDLTQFDAVMVQGDTTSAFSIALSAYHHQVPIIHLEAGLRTYAPNPYPEEFNRRAIALMADLHLCPTRDNLLCLIDEKVGGEKYIVGNTILDNLAGIQTMQNNKVLVTLHRSENISNMNVWFKALEECASQNSNLEFILPMHPNPKIKQHQHLLKTVKVVKPLPYDKLIKLMAESNFIITDSGGIQEEASFLNKRVLVCRVQTERAETIGISSWFAEPSSLLNQVRLMQEDLYRIPTNFKCPYGTGRSSEEIMKILKRYYNG